MTREEVKAVAVTLREGDEVEVGMTYGAVERRATGTVYSVAVAVERRATGTVYSVADHLYLFGVYITDGHLVSGALTYIRLIKKAPMPEPTLVGTVVITDSGYYVRVASGAVKKRWSGAVSANWSSLPNPRVATLAEIEAISRGEWVAR